MYWGVHLSGINWSETVKNDSLVWTSVKEKTDSHYLTL